MYIYMSTKNILLFLLLCLNRPTRKFFLKKSMNQSKQHKTRYDIRNTRRINNTFYIKQKRLAILKLRRTNKGTVNIAHRMEAGRRTR